MARRQVPQEPALEPKIFRTVEEIDRAIAKLRRRLDELEALDLNAAVYSEDGSERVVESNIQTTILEIFGENSPEYKEHRHIQIWAGSMFAGMSDEEILQAYVKGRPAVANKINGLIKRLQEKKEDLEGGAAPKPSSYFDKLNLHPRIVDVATDLFMDGHHWQAVFEASKALINYVKERSGRHDLDGAPLVRAVFSKNNPILSFNNLADQTDLDQQEGIMHLFEGAVFAIRNPGGHSFPEGSEQRAVEYISLLSTLAYLVQEAKKRVPHRPT